MRQKIQILLSTVSTFKNHSSNYLTPINLSFIWSMGSLLGFCMAIQVLSGIFLSFFYNSDANFAFVSVESIMRNVQFG
jgi:ubiquinol-cytochrome c reductase cytochrome b subunit